MKFFKIMLVLSLSLFSLSSIGTTQSEQPNLLFIMVDDLNDYLGVIGGHPQVKTPNIDKLAAQSVQFTRAYTNVPVCSQSRSSLFTGVYPHDSKDFGWTKLDQQFVLKNNKTFLELFKENGYQMYGTGKLLHNNMKRLWHDWGVPERMNYGPHAYDGNKIVGHPNVPEPFRSINIVDGSFAPLSDVPQFDHVNHASAGQTKRPAGWGFPFAPFRYVNENDRDLLPDEAHAKWVVEKLKTLSQQEKKSPFFIGVGFVRPHTPLYAPKRFFDMYPLESIQLPKIKPNDIDDTPFRDNYPDSQIGLHYFQALQQAYDGDELGLKLIIQAYLACVTFMDEQVGKVMDALNASEFGDNTVVLFTSDHGWQMGEKDYLYKNSPWEESTRIPLLLRLPNNHTSGQKVDQPVSLIDIYPTFQALFNLEGSHIKNKGAGPIGGHSLLPLIDNNSSTHWQGPNGALTVLGAGINTPIEGIGVRFNKNVDWHIKIIADLPEAYVWQQTYSYRTKDWRYILYKDGQEELYHHLVDPHEWQNLAREEKHQAQKQRLKQEMLALINQHRTKATPHKK